MRLIDADALKKQIIDLLENEWGYDGIREDVSKIIDNVPTIEERPHGEWKKKPRYEDVEYPDEQPDLECPFCGYSIGWWDLGYYCAKCGAKLSGSAVDDDDVRVAGEAE